MTYRKIKNQFSKLFLELLVHILISAIVVFIVIYYDFFVPPLTGLQIASLITVIGIGTYGEAIKIANKIDKEDLDKHGTRLIKTSISVLGFVIGLLPFISLVVGLNLGTEYLKGVVVCYFGSGILSYFFIHFFGHILIWDRA